MNFRRTLPKYQKLNSFYFNNKRSLIVNKSAKEHCYVSNRLGILKVKAMIGFFICYENLTEKENQLKNQNYKKVDSIINRYSKL